MMTLFAILGLVGGGFALGVYWSYNKAYDDSYKRLMKLIYKVDAINKEAKK